MDNKVFVLNKTTNLDKLSCHSYDPAALKLIDKLKVKAVKLDDLKEKIISGPMGFHLHTYDYVPENYPNRVKLLQISNIDDLGELIETQRDKYISQEKNIELKKSNVQKGDLIIAKTGELGRIALFNGEYEANLNQALGIIRLKDEFAGKKIIPEFIHHYLNSNYSTEQFITLGGYRAGQSGLSLEEIGSIYIVLPTEARQKDIIKKVQEVKSIVINEYSNYLNHISKLNTLLDECAKFRTHSTTKAWTLKNNNIVDRLDCYFYSPELEQIRRHIKQLDEKNFDVVEAKSLNIISAIKKESYEQNKFHIFKYVDIGNTGKELGEIKNYEEGILYSLPSRAKMAVLENDLLLPRPIGSTQGVIKIPKEFENQLFSTGNIQIRTENAEDSFLMWVILKSNIVQKQLFYLQSGSLQPEITPDNFKRYVLIPIPKGKLKNTLLKDGKEYYEKAVFHKKRFEDSVKEMTKVFEREINKEL